MAVVSNTSPILNLAIIGHLDLLQHYGEVEAIVLTVETGASRILLDEREARRVAKALNLSVTGVLGVLLRNGNLIT